MVKTLKIENKTRTLSEALPYLDIFREKWFANASDIELRKEDFKKLMIETFGLDSLKLGFIKLILGKSFDYGTEEFDFSDGRVFNFIKNFCSGSN